MYWYPPKTASGIFFHILGVAWRCDDRPRVRFSTVIMVLSCISLRQHGRTGCISGVYAVLGDAEYAVRICGRAA